ncbi:MULTISPECIES: replicative DNA helicase [Bradyrhizobium]|jgi:replicative DNA helicase|nr:replicative DNA helicase [Bradyrhizobium sp. LMG 8443]NPU25191.1 replicative DNA helicase [Bradyrhizobium sp. LMG 8443]HXH47613.1 replicative DNA helicase [Bradyrhizobium sp.]
MAEAAFKLAAPAGSTYRELPQNIEAEQALLGAILINNDAYYRVVDFLKANHFFEPLHGHIFEVMGELIRSNRVANPITLKAFLPTTIEIVGFSVAQYLARLAAEATTVINAPDYGRTIYDLAVRRELIKVAEDMLSSAFEAAVDSAPQEQIQHAEQLLYEIAETGRYGGGFETFETALDSAIDRAAQAYESDGKLSGLATGLKDLDARLGGLQPTDLIVVAGRPGMGKTALATNIAFNVASAYDSTRQVDRAPQPTAGGIVAFFSLEMSSEQLATRVLAEQAEISSSSIRRGEIGETEFNRLLDRRQKMRRIPLFIDQTGAISIAQLAARARRLKRQRGLHLIVVDYIQLMQGKSARAAQNRVQEITEITTGLKALAKELNVPVIALSQLSRGVENRDEKRPQLSDLRESGSIEQDADVVMFVYREEYYLKNNEPRPGTDEHFTWEAEMREARGKAEVIIAKQRHGPTGTVAMTFQGEFTRFFDLASQNQLPQRSD